VIVPDHQNYCHWFPIWQDEYTNIDHDEIAQEIVNEMLLDKTMIERYQPFLFTCRLDIASTLQKIFFR
jgi:hypothetical protein